MNHWQEPFGRKVACGEIVRVTTRPDHAIRLVLDIPENQQDALVWLIEAFQQGKLVWILAEDGFQWQT